MTKLAPYIGEAVVKRGLAKVGKSNGVGMCQKEIRTLFGVPSAGDHDKDGDADAHDAWKAARAHGQVVRDTNPKNAPRGSYLYFSGGRNGHVALGVGGGNCVSTDAGGRGRWAKIGIAAVAKKFGRKYEGYIVVTGNGYRVLEASTPVKTDKARYEVTATFLNGRSGPGLQYPVKTKRAKGFQFDSTKSSGDWVRATSRWYHTHYLKVVASKPQAAVHMRLGTLNIPLDADKLPDGKARAKLAAAQINASNLDVLALQELSRGTGYEHKYATMLLTELGAGWGIIRPTTGLNENYIFYRASRARLVDQPADVILTPLAGHRGHATGVKLNVGGKDFVFMSTHLVNGKQAGASREAQGEQLANISNATTIIMGDLNQSTVPKALARTHKTVREHIVTPMTRWGTYAKWGKDEVTIKADTILDHVLVPDSATIRGYTLVGVDQNAGTLSMPRASDHVLVVVSVVI